MRRQYHPHETEQGTLIWDVHRLVELSRDFPVIEIPVQSIRELDERSWFNGENASPTCKEVAQHFKLIEAADLSYPIILASDGRLMDGMHRVCKAWMRGDKTIKAVQFTTDPKPDYLNVPLDELPYDEPW